MSSKFNTIDICRSNINGIFSHIWNVECWIDISVKAFEFVSQVLDCGQLLFAVCVIANEGQMPTHLTKLTRISSHIESMRSSKKGFSRIHEFHRKKTTGKKSKLLKF